MVRLVVEYSSAIRPPVLVTARWYRTIGSCVREIIKASQRLDFTIILVDEVRIKALDAYYTRAPHITDVLSFRYEAESSDETATAEVFICIPQAQRQATRFGTPLRHEMARLVTHGMLHAYGYDHMQKADRIIMMKYTEDILREAHKKKIC